MLDLRLPIGIYFAINSEILILTGFITPASSQVGSSTVNLNFVWGIVMGVFGAFMLTLALTDKKKKTIKPE
jgi:hypothetical protein